MTYYRPLPEKQNTEVKTSGKTKFIVVVAVFLIISGLLFTFRKTILSLFDPVSIVASVAASDLKNTDGRTNVLVLGSDKRGQDTRQNQLTDTILIASIGKLDKDVVLISVPRDLWVESSVGFTKINALYAYGGVDELKNVLEKVLRIPIHYHVLITFDLFKESVDTLGGIEVNVENSFVDYQYPVEGKEADTCGKSWEEIEKLQGISDYMAFPCRFETVEFSSGMQQMNGETALKYARSRKGNNNEGTDFARSKRQQKVIMAIKDKALSVQTILNPIKLKELYEIYSNNVDTDMNFSTIQSFYELSSKIDFEKVISIVLDDRSAADVGGLLYAPEDRSLYGGQYVLLPKTGDYSQIHAYVQKYLFGQK